MNPRLYVHHALLRETLHDYTRVHDLPLFWDAHTASAAHHNGLHHRYTLQNDPLEQHAQSAADDGSESPPRPCHLFICHALSPACPPTNKFLT